MDGSISRIRRRILLAKTDCTGVPNTCDDIDSAVSIFEAIRQENSDLRSFGVEQYERAEGLEAEVNDLKEAIENLKDSNSDQASEIQNLCKKIDQLESEIHELKE